jgi:hypothetical protein
MALQDAVASRTPQLLDDPEVRLDASDVVEDPLLEEEMVRRRQRHAQNEHELDLYQKEVQVKRIANRRYNTVSTYRKGKREWMVSLPLLRRYRTANLTLFVP